jgi:hypothetical protein
MPPNGFAMIEVGNTFGDLVIRSIRRGAKNVHPVALCECRCGNRRTVRLTALRRDKIISCGSCAMRAAWRKRPRNSEAERWLLEAEGIYRANAKRKRREWGLSREQFRGFVNASCHYCGERRAGGIDRLDSKGGYGAPNIVSCCAPCNYAKREMTEAEFLTLVTKIYKFRCEP